MHPVVLRELADTVAEPLTTVFKSHGSQVAFLVTGKMEMCHPVLKRVIRRTPGTTKQAASPQCLIRCGTNAPEVMSKHMEDREVFRDS